MANEAVKVELYGNNNAGDQRRFSCADGNTITKGSILELKDARLASQALTYGCQLAGIAAMDKEASDGSTSISAWTNGIFELVASGAIVVGRPVIALGGGGNKVSELPMQVSSGALLSQMGAAILGYALETATDAETINVRVRL